MKTNWSDYEVYLKPVHLKGQPVTLTIVKVIEEETHPQKGKTVLSPVLYFRELPFGLILSPTNRKTLVALYGDLVADCIGKPITVQAVIMKVAGNDKQPIRIMKQRPNAPAIVPATGEIVEPSSVTEQPAQNDGDAPTATQERVEMEGGKSELDKYFGPNPRTAQPELPIDWPTNKATFEAWLKAKGINGQETRSALGTDAASWLKLNPGRTYTDVAKTIAATLAK